MSRTTALSTLVLLAGVFCLAAFASAANLPAGVVEFDTSLSAEVRNDRGYPTLAAAVDGKYLWLGRNGGMRRYDRHTGAWKFFKYNATCRGSGTINIVPDADYVWARLTTTGTLCRFDPRDESWFTYTHWTVRAHTGPGAAFIPGKDVFYVAGSGGPDWEGVSLIDRHTREWIKLLKTKPVSAMYVDGNEIWLGVPAGILKINRLSEEYVYYQPLEHGGGALIKDIVSIPGGLAFATMGDRTSILGDKIKIGKKNIQVYVEKYSRWFTYGKDERIAIIDDMRSGKLVTTSVATTPGLLLLRNGAWTLLTTRDGLATGDVQCLARDDSFLYAGTLLGITVFDIPTMKAVVINDHICKSMRQVRKIIVDGEYLWVLSQRGLFRVEKKALFSSPRSPEKTTGANHAP